MKDFLNIPLTPGDLAVWGDFEGQCLVQVQEQSPVGDEHIDCQIVRKVNGEPNPPVIRVHKRALAHYSDQYRGMHIHHIAALFNLDHAHPDYHTPITGDNNA